MTSGWKTIVAQSRRLAPYLAVELFLPGGTLIAILMWAREHRRALRGDS